MYKITVIFSSSGYRPQPLDSKLQTTVVSFVGKRITASVIHLSTKKQPEHYALTKPEANQTI
jgi:hypothetical protein